MAAIVTNATEHNPFPMNTTFRWKIDLGWGFGDNVPIDNQQFQSVPCLNTFAFETFAFEFTLPRLPPFATFDLCQPYTTFSNFWLIKNATYAAVFSFVFFIGLIFILMRGILHEFTHVRYTIIFWIDISVHVKFKTEVQQ